MSALFTRPPKTSSFSSSDPTFWLSVLTTSIFICALFLPLGLLSLGDFDPLRSDRLANHDVSGRRARNGAAHDQQIVFGIHFRNLQVSHRDAIPSHAARRAH